jgi:type VI secretion system protein ImpH
MASENRPTAAHLIAEVATQPHAFDFYAAVRLLQCRFDSHRRFGYSEFPNEDPVRFAQSPALTFAPSTIEALRQPDPARPPVFYSRHFGLFGPNGPLPVCLTEYAHDRIRHHGDATFAAFCNVFHHRLISFFFRVWADANKTVDFDRADDQHWSQFVGSLVGLGLDSLHDRDHLPDNAKLYYAGRFIQQNRNAEGLAAILQDFFGIHTEVETFVGRWLKLAGNGSDPGHDYRCQLGRSAATGRLGSNLIVGSQFWNCQMHFRLRLGPMRLADLERLLPSGSSWQRLHDFVLYYAGHELTWDAQLVLDKEEVPKTQIGKAGRLGWTTWLKTQPFEKDPDDLVLQGSL